MNSISSISGFGGNPYLQNFQANNIVGNHRHHHHTNSSASGTDNNGSGSNIINQLLQAIDTTLGSTQLGLIGRTTGTSGINITV